ncbi:MAG: hypothetical protein V1794_09735, partial [Candidatus Glassbacteria bacterium]
MQDKDIQGILKKVEELKAVFTFGVRFVPFLEDLLIFVQEMGPMLNQMNQSIQESSSKMPQAVQQLDKATSTTELATREILDRLDDLLAKLDGINENFQKVKERLEHERQTVDRITSSVEKLLKIEPGRQQLAKVFENEQARNIGVEIKTAVDEFLAGRLDQAMPEQVDRLLQDVQSDAFDIMNALQVQDITAQQIKGAHSLLSLVQERLNELIVKYSQAEPLQEIIREAKAFDEQASFTDSESHQTTVDEVFDQEEKTAGESGAEADQLAEEGGEAAAAVEDEQAMGGQDEVDTLFDDMSAETAEAGVPESEAFETQEAAGEPVGQEDIDELLDWGGDEEKAEGTAASAEPTLDEMVEAEIAEKEVASVEISVEELFAVEPTAEAAEPEEEVAIGEDQPAGEETLALETVAEEAAPTEEKPAAALPVAEELFAAEPTAEAAEPEEEVAIGEDQPAGEETLAPETVAEEAAPTEEKPAAALPV